MSAAIKLGKLIGAESSARLLPYYSLLAENIARRAKNVKLLVAISGCQGSGKSTMTAVLPDILFEHHAIHCAGFSLDDVYKTRAERKVMSENIHPLFLTRGAPGTHDLAMAQQNIDNLFSGRGKICTFDKSIDDRLRESLWPEVSRPYDMVIVEGWCMACPPQPGDLLANAVNHLEKQRDADGTYRRKVNQYLENEYAAFFRNFDYVAALLAPGFESVLKWRLKQEKELRIKTRNESAGMTDDEVEEFVQYFERLTRYLLQILPVTADATLFLNNDQQITDCRFKNHAV